MSAAFRPSEGNTGIGGHCGVDECRPAGDRSGYGQRTITVFAPHAEAQTELGCISKPLLQYLDDAQTDPWGLDVTFEVRLNEHLVSRPPFAGMYWTGAQMLARMTINGASLRTGDFYASHTFLEDDDEGRHHRYGAGPPWRRDRSRRGARADPAAGDAADPAASGWLGGHENR